MKGNARAGKKMRYMRSPGVGDAVLRRAVNHFDTSVFQAMKANPMSEFEDIFRLVDHRMAQLMNVQGEFNKEQNEATKGRKRNLEPRTMIFLMSWWLM